MVFRHVRFFRAQPLHLVYGFAFTFFSSTGQTFFLSLYAFATTLSGICLMKFGERIDCKAITPYVWRVILLLATSVILLSLTTNIAMLLIALFGLRFAGQGLMTHISQTLIARHFNQYRGKALSFSGLGYPLGEMFYPTLIAFLIPLIGWRMSLFTNVVILLAVMMPLLVLQYPGKIFKSVNHEKHNTASAFLWIWHKDHNFLRILPSMILPAIILTAVFFYQMVIGR
ncbi:MAG: MFS transporter [Victivallaceae bacterium]